MINKMLSISAVLDCNRLFSSSHPPSDRYAMITTMATGSSAGVRLVMVARGCISVRGT